MYLTVGITGAFPTILIPALTAKNTESVLHLTIDQASWFGTYLIDVFPLHTLSNSNEFLIIHG